MRRGESEGFVQIWLSTGRSDPVVMKRSLKAAENASEWRINGEPPLSLVSTLSHCDTDISTRALTAVGLPAVYKCNTSKCGLLRDFWEWATTQYICEVWRTGCG